MHATLALNWRGFESIPVPLEEMLAALSKDKKNSAKALGLILPDKSGKIRKFDVPADESFRAAVAEYLPKGRSSELP